MLRQAVELSDDYTVKIRACDAQIERQCAAMKPRVASDAPLPPLPPVKPGSTSKNQPAYHVRAHLMRLTGVDLVAVTGLGLDRPDPLVRGRHGHGPIPHGQALLRVARADA